MVKIDVVRKAGDRGAAKGNRDENGMVVDEAR